MTPGGRVARCLLMSACLFPSLSACYGFDDIDRVELSIIEETQPRWLSFLNGEMDLIFLVPEEFAYQAFPNRKVNPNLARRGTA